MLRTQSRLEWEIYMVVNPSELTMIFMVASSRYLREVGYMMRAVLR